MPSLRLQRDRTLPARSINPHYIAVDLYIVLWYIAVWGMWYIDNRRHALITAIGVVAIAIAPKRSIISMRIALSIAPILVWILLSKFWSWNPSIFNAEFMRTIIDAPVLMVLGAIVPWERLVSRLLLWFYMAMGFTWLYSMLKSDARVALSDGAITWSWHGSFVHKNVMLVFLLFGLALVLGFEHRRRVRRAALFSVVALVVMSHSTTGLAALVVVLAFVVWIKLLQAERTSRRAGFMFVTVVCSAALLTVGTLSIPLLAQVAGKDATFSGRTRIWSACWWAITREPLKGYGLAGVFSGVDLPPTKEMVRQIGFEAASAHNGVLDLLLQLG
ncbi:MAG TPA: O-antigen ligase family protein, partial [Ilumatobacteraceae bacterium]|nr:O-antigen ligase family protein [Ilumatobacteraceae bacterium]